MVNKDEYILGNRIHGADADLSGERPWILSSGTQEFLKYAGAELWAQFNARTTV